MSKIFIQDQAINRTERGLENKLHSAVMTDVFKSS